MTDSVGSAAGTGGAWQRIFDFGNSDASEGAQGNGVTYLFFTPMTSSTGFLRVAFTLSGIAGESYVHGTAALPANAMVHVAVSFDGVNNIMALYLNGVFQGQAVLFGSLSGLGDVNNWLGRSQFMADPEFGGTIQEFRIYSTARTPAQIQAELTAGPDTLPTQ